MHQTDTTSMKEFKQPPSPMSFSATAQMSTVKSTAEGTLVDNTTTNDVGCDAKKTRSGRIIKPPSRLNLFVKSRPLYA